ncbi:MAG: hypothetical protein K2L21_07145 [Muribaculaceae bacterium]|nr:hypothetical protein [Muribaculaceae bacterium]
MDAEVKYMVMAVAHRARLLLRTDAEYRRVLGVSMETVAAKRGSRREMDACLDAMEREAAKIAERPLAAVVGDYVEASEVYLGLDWGDRTQMASRRRLCRMVFRLYAAGGRELSAEEVVKYKSKEADGRLLAALLPEGPAGEPAVDPGMLLLMAYGVLKPWKDTMRGHDTGDAETMEAMQRLRGLVEQLREDMPRLGSTEKPLIFEEWLGLIDSYMNDGDELADCTPLWMISCLAEIAQACRSLVISEEQREVGEKFVGLFMDGIWVDDADGGRSRFWIFPDNRLGAFCFRRDGLGWEMVPYDFRVRRAENDDYKDIFLMLDPWGNCAYTLDPRRVIESHQMASGLVEQVHDDAGDLRRLEFSEGPRPLPAWLDWKTWERLSPEDGRHAEFRTVLRNVYDREHPLSLFFTNVAPEITDMNNNLVGRDHRYLYVHDRPRARFRMVERGEDVYVYESSSPDDAAPKALFEIEVTPEHPLYAIPVEVEKRPYGDEELDRLAEILTDAANINEVYVVHLQGSHNPRLVLPAYGATIELDMEALGRLGVLRFTSRPW